MVGARLDIKAHDVATVAAEPTELLREEKNTCDRLYPESKALCGPSIHIRVLTSFHFQRSDLFVIHSSDDDGDTSYDGGCKD